MSINLQLKSLFGRIEKNLKETISSKEMKYLAKQAIVIIVRRTRLGYGNGRNFGERKKLKPLSKDYVEQRKQFRGLSSLTRPKKSNLTRTGQLLDSMKILSAKDGKVVIGPSGNRKDSTASNAEVAEYQRKQGRPFNRFTMKEYNQIQRIYRQRFGDLLRKKRVIK